MKTVRVWDLPLRLFHWALVVLVSAAIITGNLGGEYMDAHFYCAYAILALLLFRLIWGVAGSVYARFASFLAGPRAVLAYLKTAASSSAEHRPGHNPLGGWSVVAMLTVLLLQVGSGLFSNDDIAREGPLAILVSRDWSATLTWFHTEVSINILYGLIGLHVLAIAYYALRKKINLVGPMLSGDMQTTLDVPAAQDTRWLRLRGLLIFLLCCAVIYFFFLRNVS